jgi:ribulose-5-phosphate 4-epimerase/fuculose-1-phosphate aldolase
MKFKEIREQIVETSKQMLSEKLVTNTAGNISMRIPGENLAAITPSGRPYLTMTPEEVAIVDLDGALVEGDFKPSSETPMHTMIYRTRADIGAIVHTHSPYALAFAVTHRDIPLICIEGLCNKSQAVLVAEYGVPGTEEIGRRALEALDRQPGSIATLLANHGLLTIGPTLQAAYAAAGNIEMLAMVYHLALQIGTPVCVTEEQVFAIRNKYQVKKD